MVGTKSARATLAVLALFWMKLCASAAFTNGQALAPAGPTTGGWHLVKTAGPKDQPEIVSVMHTADALNSDPDFAGIMLRCTKGGGVQIGFVLITPLPPRSAPQVAVSTAAGQLSFKAAAIAPGTIVALPPEAEALLNGPWSTAKSISVRIQTDGHSTINGAVPTDHLTQALTALRQNCRE